MAQATRLIIGLGNPGPAYAETRHNAGFMVVDAIAAQRQVTLAHDKGNVFYGTGRWRGRPFGLAKPMTYMNLSGQAVLALLRRHGLTPADLLVVYDDINLPPGALRLRPSGSAGGHNGVQDTIDRLGTDAFPRLRLGVGNDFSRGRQADYVLAPFSPEQRVLFDEALPDAVAAALTFVSDGLHVAMNRYNRRGKSADAPE